MAAHLWCTSELSQQQCHGKVCAVLCCIYCCKHLQFLSSQGIHCHKCGGKMSEFSFVILQFIILHLKKNKKHILAHERLNKRDEMFIREFTLRKKAGWAVFLWCLMALNCQANAKIEIRLKALSFFTTAEQNYQQKNKIMKKKCNKDT